MSNRGAGIKSTHRKSQHDAHQSASKRLSWLLRHSTALAEHMDPDGFVSFDVLLRCWGAGGSREFLLDVIGHDQKGRYEVRGDDVRAVNGHSVHFCDNYAVIEPPQYLYHATNSQALPRIMASALQRMGRHYIHMYDRVPEKTSVRYRILRIKPPREHVYYRTKNGYVLCRDDIPACYLEVLD